MVIGIRIDRIILLDEIIEKIRRKHNVTVTEVEDVFKNNPKFRRGPAGNYVKENIYYALGSTDTNRLLREKWIIRKNLCIQNYEQKNTRF